MKYISVTLMKLDEFNEIVVGYLFPGGDPFLPVTKYVFSWRDAVCDFCISLGLIDEYMFNIFQITLKHNPVTLLHMGNLVFFYKLQK